MPRFPPNAFLPRLGAGDVARHLAPLHGAAPEEITTVPIDLKRAEFHPSGETRSSEAELRGWRDDLNSWARDFGFPSKLDSKMRSAWDVELGERLVADLHGLPEATHPNVWCWLATDLLPHFVVYRWDWPERKNDEIPSTRGAWARFGADSRNGLRVAAQRIVTYGRETAEKASEQEFQSILNRPAFGSDPRVAKAILDALLAAWEDPDSYYGKSGGTRALDANYVSIELRFINSLQPFCFMSDDEIAGIVRRVIEDLPRLRKESDAE